jgi:NACalpha-BTF3-like transcription factor
LFPTEHPENSEWIAAWHHLQSINKALKFLREFVTPNTAAAVMAAADIAKMFGDAADVVQDRLKKRPQDRCLLKLPAFNLDLHERIVRVEVEDDSDVSDQSSDDDFMPAPANRNRMRARLPAPLVDRHQHDEEGPAPAERPELWQRFEGMVQFVMDSCAVNRRAATDALFANDRNVVRAIESLLQ